jgi:hypothetical protein
VHGKTLDTLSGFGLGRGSPTDMAAYYFAGLLSSTFGKQNPELAGHRSARDHAAVPQGGVRSDGARHGRQASERLGQGPRSRRTSGRRRSRRTSVLGRQPTRASWIARATPRPAWGGELQYARQFAEPDREPAGRKRPPPWLDHGERGTGHGSELVKAREDQVGDPFDRGACCKAATAFARRA